MQSFKEVVIAWWTNFLKRFEKPKPVVVPESLPLVTKNLRSTCIEKFELVDPSIYENYTYSDGLWLEAELPWTDIETYTRKVNYAADRVSKEKEIPRDWYPETSTLMNLDRFLLTESGYYLDRVEAVTNLKKAALALCVAMEKCDTEPFGVYEHNKRMLTGLLKNLQFLGIMLKLKE